MIPKIIHYCWFGRGQMPDLALKCIESWKKYLPEYELHLWNEDNFDVDSNKFVKEAYRNKKYAFVTDMVRLYALYNFGGIYMDTDVEVLRPLDEFLDYPAFSGFEVEEAIPTGIMGAEKGSTWARRELEYYKTQSFILPNGAFNTKPNVQIITEHALLHGLKPNGKFQIVNDELAIFPKDYFCPKSYVDGQIYLTENTFTIHHFAGSWHNEDKMSINLKKIFGEVNGGRLYKLYHLLRKRLFRL